MNRLILATTVAMLLASSAASAGPGHGKGNADHSNQRDSIVRGDHDRNTTEHRDWRGDEHHGDRHDARPHHARHAQDWKAAGLHDNGRHVGQRRHAWARGQRLPHDYLASRYYVTNYRAYNLSRPPEGYQWVRPYQDDNRYYLVQTVTGLISRIFGGP